MEKLDKIDDDFIYVLLDANFILLPIQFKIDIYDEIRNLIPGKVKLVVIKATIDELNRKMNKKKQKTYKMQAKIGLQILEQHIRDKPNLFLQIDREKQPGEYVDDILVEVAKQIQDKSVVYVASNDKNLREKCADANILPLFMRQGKLIKI